MSDTFTTSIPEPPTTAPTESLASTLATLPASDSPHLVLLTDTGTPAVVLTHRRDRVELLLADTTVITVPAHTPATTITDPAQQTDLLCAAVTHFRTHLNNTQSARDTADIQHRQVLDNIRRYAIARHRDRECRRGLDKFLTTFDMDPYLPPLRVNFTITGSYVVHDSATDTAEQDGTGLRVDFTNITNLEHGSTHSYVTIDSVDDTDRDPY